MLMIRLQRAGKRNRPEFRIVLAEKESSASKKFTEILGNYNPRTKDFTIKEDRLKYWVAQHVSLSATVHNLFVTKKLIDASKVKAFSIPAKPVAAETPAAPVGTDTSASDASSPAETPEEAPAEATLPVSLEPETPVDSDEAVVVASETTAESKSEAPAESSTEETPLA